VRVAAVADVHSPKYLEEFKDSLSIVETPEVLLLAGDMINFGISSEYRNIIDSIDSILGSDVPVVACFGNEEFIESRDSILELTQNRISFLDGESLIIKNGELEIGIVGAPAPTDVIDASKGLNHQDIRGIFETRASLLSSLVKDVASKADQTVLLMHYSPLSERPNDKNVSEYSWWISKTIKEVQPNLVIHGHIHGSKMLRTSIGRTRIFNVAFPATNTVTEIVL
jgi:Icc-related predicted phosphoesterase